MPADVFSLSQEGNLPQGSEGSIDSGTYTHLTANADINNAFGKFAVRNSTNANKIEIGGQAAIGVIVPSTSDRQDEGSTGLFEGVKEDDPVAIKYRGNVVVLTDTSNDPSVGSAAYVDSDGLLTSDSSRNYLFLGEVLRVEGKGLGEGRAEVRLTGVSPITSATAS